MKRFIAEYRPYVYNSIGRYCIIYSTYLGY